MKKISILLTVLFSLIAMNCATNSATYNTKNGKIYMTGNCPSGLFKNVYECTPDGSSMNCVAMPDNP
ncbi:MAG: hypothetical protein H7A25_11480 [Leptospiraceae bacterium]|nr:hypothetical protein [Leptospiraceae bacterium]MCP5500517.1 hypothetical protein [Leptospiraceae bacterium]